MSHLCTTFLLQKLNLRLTDLLQPISLTISRGIVPKAAGGFSATYMLTVQTEKIRQDMSVCSHLSMALYRQKRHFKLTDVVRLTPLIISFSSVPTAVDGFSATHLLTVQTDEIWPDRSVRSHPSTTLYFQTKTLSLLTSSVPLLPSSFPV